MAGAKYYVWASGAWREVQASGRVAGWQRRARFLFVRRGRLQLAPRGVLRALAAHAAGQPSAVRDGPRLSQRSYVHGYKAPEAPATSDRTHCQNAHNRSKGSAVAARGPPAPAPAPAPARTADTSTQCTARADAGTQASPTHARAPTHTRALTLNIHTQRTHTSDDDFQTKPTLKPGPRTHSERRARAAAETRAPAARAPSTSSSESLIHFVTKKTVANIEKVPAKNDKTPTKNKILKSDSSDDSEVTFDNNKHSLKSPVKTKTVARNSKINVGKLVNSETSDDGVKVIYDKTKRNGRRRAPDDEPGLKRPKIDKEQASHNKSKANLTSMSRKPIVENLSDTSESDTETKLKDISSDSEILAKVSQRAVTQQAAGSGSSSDEVVAGARRGWGRAGAGGRARCLELVVPERDVELLREYIARSRCADLHRFDTCDHYKTGLFYSINPVVDIERCARMERALRERALKHFTEGLGLRSVSEVSTQPSTYKTRKRIRNNSKKASSHGDSVESLEENTSQEGSGRLHADKSISIRDDSEDNTKEPNKSRSKQLSKKPHGHKSTRHRPEDNSKTTKSSKKMSTHRSHTTRDSSQDTEDRTSRSHTKKLTRKSKKSLNRPNAKAHDSEPTGDSSEDEDSRRKTKKLKYKPSSAEPAAATDSTEDTSEQHDRITIKKSTNKPKTRPIEIISDSSEDTTEELIEDGLTKEKSKSSKKPGAAESSAEFKENVPRRANRLRGAGDDSGGGGGGEPATSRAALLRAARSSHTISKRPSAWAANEYSNLEDHAIVAWLSAGGGLRARRVNGNAVWRELQDQYPALAGRARSWHSLRNRYLRYILPALAALRLPPTHAARLRAAAATGDRKRKPQPPRRNSIFDREPPARAAASRRPRPARTPPPASPTPPSPVDDEDAPPASPRRRSLRSSGVAPAPAAAAAAPAPAPAARSPRYSDVTRQFASRKLRSTPRSSMTSPRDPSPPPAPPATRTRKLYNPNKLL